MFNSDQLHMIILKNCLNYELINKNKNHSTKIPSFHTPLISCLSEVEYIP